MEIEKKYLLSEIPFDLSSFEKKEISQGYLCTSPVVRIRKSNDKYTLTYKGEGLMAREEYNLPLNAEAYKQLSSKIDGILIEKTRYLIPLENNLVAELDVFHGKLNSLLLVEVEFASVEEANNFVPPTWFGEDVTFSNKYHNSTLSQKNL
ncbi:CYTH domain-containing protein [Lachnobacterium bovis]|jgi:CYTH domain-containing protein|uniref:CYTH domain-containing protein n=1 Tax=Lachnobacterium bovis TaxID=140626 RepID=A0A1H9U2J0_9FIRM|nr:CYTH domain-containing protein [Lachnobacterium bovis]SES03387.1 CYTH domain-containing protein [Lachnobacterium bovis]